ncbi:hypothetical protein [Vibrio sagamiensis]|uniref:Uncharacterized protein n=1 Tax=Vibrio sagamiensis NBRC 104589 TaxID=1219064 RepID=A0A511QK59_9VIBR|nr:hypothetical protein [Vibrio sagamiensis]GEM77577.1 hypothetical protein VSA01S_36890 [Vibrio sagamiensis NBRC 104589]
MRLLKFSIIIFILSTSSLYVSASEIQYKIGGKNFSFPSSYIVDLSPWGWLKSIGGLDEEVNSVYLEFSSSEIKLRNLGIRRSIFVSVEYYADLAKKRYLDTSRWSSIWYAKNHDSDREVLFDDLSQFYFIFEKHGYRGLFDIFSVMPTGELPVNRDDFYVATCDSSSISEIKHSGCTRQLLIDDLMIEIGFPFHYLSHIQDIETFVISKLNAWEVK